MGGEETCVIKDEKGPGFKWYEVKHMQHTVIEYVA